MENAISRLAAAKNSIAYKTSGEAILNPGRRVTFNTMSGSGRYISISNHKPQRPGDTQ